MLHFDFVQQKTLYFSSGQGGGPSEFLWSFGAMFLYLQKFWELEAYILRLPITCENEKVTVQHSTKLSAFDIALWQGRIVNHKRWSG